jgi:YVTN family beta-propeller protein
MRYFNGKLYIANMTAKSLSIIDVASGLISEVALGGVAVQVAVTPDGKYVFASLYDTKEVARYEIQSGTVTRIALPVGSQGPIQLYPTPDGKLLYVCDQGNLMGRPSSNKVYEINISNSQVTNTITVGNAAHGVVVSKDGKTAYVTNNNDNSVSVIDISSKTVKTTVTVQQSPNGISYWFDTGGMP